MRISTSFSSKISKHVGRDPIVRHSDHPLRLFNQPLYLKPCIALRKHVEQFPPPWRLFPLHIKLLHAHDQPPGVIHADTTVLYHDALAQHKIVGLSKFPVEGDGGMRRSEFAAEFEFGEGGEEEGSCGGVGMAELKVVEFYSLLRCGVGRLCGTGIGIGGGGWFVRVAGDFAR